MNEFVKNARKMYKSTFQKQNQDYWIFKVKLEPSIPNTIYVFSKVGQAYLQHFNKFFIFLFTYPQQDPISNIFMDAGFSNFPNSSLMYAQNCPEQPLILERSLVAQQPSIHEAKPTPKSVKSNIVYHPHIITAKKWSQNSSKGFEEVEHERELSILQNRIRNCKSLAQRKKDRNDPILYPAYFIRDKKRCKDVRIDAYFRKVVQGGEKCKPTKRKQTRKIIKDDPERLDLQQQQQTTRQSFWKLEQRDQKRFTRSNFPLPPVTNHELHRKQRKQHQSLLNLPLPNSQSIVSFIIQRKMFLEGDLRILKARLIHNYGSEIQRQWRSALHYILRQRPAL